MTDEEKLDAVLDGEMEEPERAAFEARLAADPALRASLDSRRALDADLKDAYAHARGSHRGEPSGSFRLPPPKRRVPMVLVPLAAAAGLLAGFLGPALFGEKPMPPVVPAPEPRVAGFVTQATGPLLLAGGRKLHKGQPIHESDVLTTVGTDRATLMLGDGTEVRLDRGTSVRIVELFYPEHPRNPDGTEWLATAVPPWDGRRIEVVGGRIWARVAETDRKSIFSLLAGPTRVTVTGTELSVRRTLQETEVQLFSGSAKVEAAGTTRELAPGQEAEFADGKLSDARRIGSEAIATGWMLELVAHSGGHDRELAEHLDRLLVDMGHTKAVMIEERALVSDLAGSCRIPLARYLVSDGARMDLEPRRKAARVLERIADGSVAVELSSALRDPDAEVRVSAASALARVSKGKVCPEPEFFRAACDDGACSLAEAWAKAQVTPK